MGSKLSQGPGGKVRSIGANADINVTPFVDIMLVLLIIFMVVAPLATVSIKLDLPPATPPPPGEEPKDPVLINIQESGRVYVVDQETTIDGLPSTLCSAVQAQGITTYCREERIFVRGDAEVKYGQFMEVMNRLQGTGWLKVGLLNEDIE